MKTSQLTRLTTVFAAIMILFVFGFGGGIAHTIPEINSHMLQYSTSSYTLTHALNWVATPIILAAVLILFTKRLSTWVFFKVNTKSIDALNTFDFVKIAAHICGAYLFTLALIYLFSILSLNLSMALPTGHLIICFFQLILGLIGFFLARFF